jgi:hypothetical protein
MLRQVGKPLAMTVALAASVVKQTAKRLTATVALTATLAALRVFLRTLTATVAVSATLTRRVGKFVAATVSVSAALTRRIAKTLTATVGTAASLLADLFSPFAVVFTTMFDPPNPTITTHADVDAAEYEVTATGASTGDTAAGEYDPPQVVLK